MSQIFTVLNVFLVISLDLVTNTFNQDFYNNPCMVISYAYKFIFK